MSKRVVLKLIEDGGYLINNIFTHGLGTILYYGNWHKDKNFDVRVLSSEVIMEGEQDEIIDTFCKSLERISKLNESELSRVFFNIRLIGNDGILEYREKPAYLGKHLIEYGYDTKSSKDLVIYGKLTQALIKYLLENSDELQNCIINLGKFEEERDNLYHGYAKNRNAYFTFSCLLSIERLQTISKPGLGTISRMAITHYFSPLHVILFSLGAGLTSLSTPNMAIFFIKREGNTPYSILYFNSCNYEYIEKYSDWKGSLISSIKNTFKSKKTKEVNISKVMRYFRQTHLETLAKIFTLLIYHIAIMETERYLSNTVYYRISGRGQVYVLDDTADFDELTFDRNFRAKLSELSNADMKNVAEILLNIYRDIIDAIVNLKGVNKSTYSF